MTYADDAAQTVLRALNEMEQADPADDPTYLANDLWLHGYLGLANDVDAIQDILDLWLRINADETTISQWADDEEIVKSRILDTIVRVRANAEADLRDRVKRALESYEAE